MNAKHTKGPWRVEKWSDKQGSNGISIMAGNIAIANMVMQLDDKEKDYARLIAAAPELLEALKQLVKTTNAPNWQLAIDAIDKAE